MSLVGERSIEIDKLEIQLAKQPKNVKILCRLADLLIDDRKLLKSKPHIDAAASIFKISQLSVTQGLEVLGVMLKYWKSDKYSGKSKRLNIDEKRHAYLGEIEEVAVIARRIEGDGGSEAGAAGSKKGISKGSGGSSLTQAVSVHLAFVKEAQGQFQDALAILSDLIAAQAVGVGVDLSYIIYKAATLLQHLGQVKQSIEYLEFVADDPPEGYLRIHVLALLAHVYETGGAKYQVFLPKTYRALQDLSNAKINNTTDSSFEDQNVSNVSGANCDVSDTRLLMKLHAASAAHVHGKERGGAGGKGNNLTFYSQGSELWELLGVQALERCEYVLAAGFLGQAAAKAPKKGRLLYLLAEVHTLLQEPQVAAAYAERAYVFNPNSAPLRNLLLLVAPDSWTEKLRSVPPSAAEGFQLDRDTDTPALRYAAADEDSDDEGAEWPDELGFGERRGRGQHGEPLRSPSSRAAQGGAGGGEGGRGGARAGLASPSAGAGPLGHSRSFREKALADQDSWVVKIRTKAGEALKAVNSGASISDAIAAANSAGNTVVAPSSSPDARPSLSASPSMPFSQSKQKQGQQGQRTTSPSKNNGATEANPSGAAGTGTAAGGNARGSYKGRSGSSKRSAVTAAKKMRAAKEQEASSKANATDATVAAADPNGGERGLESTTGNAVEGVILHSATGKASSAGAAGSSVVEWGVSQADGEEASVRSGSVRLNPRPQKPPALDSESQRVLALVLNGNENIPIFDPNLRVLVDMKTLDSTR